MSNEERWKSPDQRKLIEESINRIDATDLSMIRATLWCTEGTPWHFLAQAKAMDYIATKRISTIMNILR